MQKQVFEWDLAGHTVTLTFLDPHTRYRLFPPPRPAADQAPQIAVTPEMLEQVRPFLPEDATDSFAEYRCLILLSARLLLRYRCCIFHAAAFRWRDRAWLLTASPGTGKTTQYLNWQRMFPGEIQMISGDMPILESREDGSVWVHPSSWNGKEKLRGAESAPLGGLVLLEQGKDDRIVSLSAQEGLVPLLQQFMVFPETEEEILRIAGLLERMLLTAPHWKMVNRGGDASTRLLRETLEQSIQEAE